MSDEKITQIQETLAHQEQEIATLNQMVTRQWDEIDLLKKQIRKLQGSLAEVTENQTVSAAEQAARDKPPHY
ncbi:MAG: SlyX family protein [bacterium]|nr:SlyX family protein [bacterium]